VNYVISTNQEKKDNGQYTLIGPPMK